MRRFEAHINNNHIHVANSHNSLAGSTKKMYSLNYIEPSQQKPVLASQVSLGSKSQSKLHEKNSTSQNTRQIHLKRLYMLKKMNNQSVNLSKPNSSVYLTKSSSPASQKSKKKAAAAGGLESVDSSRALYRKVSRSGRLAADGVGVGRNPPNSSTQLSLDKQQYKKIVTYNKEINLNKKMVVAGSGTADGSQHQIKLITFKEKMRLQKSARNPMFLKEAVSRIHSNCHGHGSKGSPPKGLRHLNKINESLYNPVSQSTQFVRVASLDQETHQSNVIEATKG